MEENEMDQQKGNAYHWEENVVVVVVMVGVMIYWMWMIATEVVEIQEIE
jgi:hypothetical protein